MEKGIIALGIRRMPWIISRMTFQCFPFTVPYWNSGSFLPARSLSGSLNRFRQNVPLKKIFPNIPVFIPCVSTPFSFSLLRSSTVPLVIRESWVFRTCGWKKPGSKPGLRQGGRKNNNLMKSGILQKERELRDARTEETGDRRKENGRKTYSKPR